MFNFSQKSNKFSPLKVELPVKLFYCYHEVKDVNRENAEYLICFLLIKKQIKASDSDNIPIYQT